MPIPDSTPATLGSISIKRPTIDQHLLEIEHNRAAWERKPLLRLIYDELYQQVVQYLWQPKTARTVELGSGMGSIKHVLPQCITTDLFPNPWLDRQENAYQLSFASGSVGNLILFDVWHHLRYPGTALAEFHRVLQPGGRVVLVEPAISWTSRFVYGLFHHEPLALDAELTWLAPAGFSPDRVDYYAAPSSATRLFWRGDLKPELLAGWRVCDLKPIASFAYIGSGGFAGPQLYPVALLPVVRRLDRLLGCWPRAFAARLIIVLEKNA